MLVPFLRYLYCEPQRLSENALLRHGLLRVLLQPRGAFQSDVPTATRVVRELIRSLFDLLPYMLVSRKWILTVLLKSLEGCNKKVNIILYIIHCCEFHMVPCFIWWLTIKLKHPKSLFWQNFLFSPEVLSCWSVFFAPVIYSFTLSQLHDSTLLHYPKCIQYITINIAKLIFNKFQFQYAYIELFSFKISRCDLSNYIFKLKIYLNE